MKKKISELKTGDLVDLQHDRFADNGEHPEFEFEYSEVFEAMPENANCTVVEFSHGTFGFPPDHLGELAEG